MSAARGGLSYEVYPSDRIVDDVVAHLPRGSKVSVTVSPARGIDPTRKVAVDLAEAGFRVTAHLAARMFRAAAEAADHAVALQQSGVASALLLAGDMDLAAGGLAGAIDLHHALHERSASFPETLFAAYPEGHPHLSPDDERTDLHAKSAIAQSLVTQICLSPRMIHSWISRVRADGVWTPIRVGIPGPAVQARLDRIMIDLGLRAVGEVVADDGDSSLRFDPTPLATAVASGGASESVESLHVYTFNEVALTRRFVDTKLREFASDR